MRQARPTKRRYERYCDETLSDQKQPDQINDVKYLNKLLLKLRDNNQFANFSDKVSFRAFRQ